MGADQSPSPDQQAAARGQALRRLRAAIAEEAGRREPVRRSRRRAAFATRPAALAGSLVAVLVAVLAVGVALSLLRARPATARLDELAGVAGAAAAPEPAGDEFLYSRSMVVGLVQEVAPDGEVVSFLLPETEERWLDASGQLRIRREFGEPRFFDEAAEAAFAAAGLGDVFAAGLVDDGLFQPAQVAGTSLVDWATEPDELRRQMLADVETGGNTEVAEAARMLELGAGLLQATGATPELRAAVLRVLADQPDVTATADGGTVSVSVDYTVGGRDFTREVVFETAGAGILTERVVAHDELPGGVPAGTVVSSRTNEATLTVPDLESPPTTG